MPFEPRFGLPVPPVRVAIDAALRGPVETGTLSESPFYGPLWASHPESLKGSAGGGVGLQVRS
eukprot:3664724-Amphidinium_carterae.1